jgi:hypothetical protein
MSKKIKIVTAIIVILCLIAFIAYRLLNPPGPITDPVPNPVRDRATKDWTTLESQVPKNEYRDVYFGDVHVHTSYSFDAFIGGTKTTPEDAYKFAQGGSVNVQGVDVKIQRPLDFAAVTDHSEYLGELYSISDKDAPGHNTLTPRYVRSIQNDTAKQAAFFQNMLRNVGHDVKKHPRFFRGYETTKIAWDRELAAAENNYRPGEFTTMAAYEWTLGNGMAHAHRNVFFRDMVVPDYPISAIEASDEEQLWASLDEFRNQGSTVIAVPHNTNLSSGTAFPYNKPDGTPIDKEYVAKRNANEPLVEIHQTKGNSEVYARFWENDEFADFENYNQGKEDINNFVRHALKRGLAYEETLGTNPYKYGIMGSTDTHNGTPGNTEENDEYVGNHAGVDATPELRSTRDWILEPSVKTYKAVNPGGLIAVWAKANTRSDIYDAMVNKETYATSGGRMKIRFFAGFDFAKRYDAYDRLVADGYELGVPMGGDLSLSKHKAELSNNEIPQFIVWASKDPIGANLERIQIIKGWYENNELYEKIYNVALSDERVVNPDGTVDDLGPIVNLTNGAVDQSKGDTELISVWSDPDFNPNLRAFYYARVLEVPTPRYTLWDEIRAGVKYPDEVPKTIRERAWSSPIWYSPEN